MSNIIDRRLNPRDKTIKNRQKFLHRSRDLIRDKVKESIDKGNIADIENGKLRVRTKGISEPTFSQDRKTGDKKYILPGNKEFIAGDTQDKPSGGQGKGGREGGLGESEDDFEFVLNPDEYLDFIFDDLELPDLVKKTMADVTKKRMKRTGFTNVGNPSQLDVVRSLRNSLGRRIGLKRPKNEEIIELEQKIEQATEEEKPALLLLLQELKRKQKAIPWLDPFDVRYRNFTPQPEPITKAVMVCIMDVSGSMTQREKDLAKRFFFLLHLFLNRKYQKVELVFVKHHETAKEVDEEEFFHSRESGGTVVSSALELSHEILTDRYDTSQYNIYVAQVSDGDNYGRDEDAVDDFMHKLLPIVQYFAYIEIGSDDYSELDKLVHTNLWAQYEDLSLAHKNLAMRIIRNNSDIWHVFRSLFDKETSNA